MSDWGNEAQPAAGKGLIVPSRYDRWKSCDNNSLQNANFLGLIMFAWSHYLSFYKTISTMSLNKEVLTFMQKETTSLHCFKTLSGNGKQLSVKK